jgi:hypothetical protein
MLIQPPYNVHCTIRCTEEYNLVKAATRLASIDERTLIPVQYSGLLVR